MSATGKVITVRHAVLNAAHKTCADKGWHLYLTGHFIERVNLRSPNQDNTFIFFMKCFNHLTQHVPDYVKQTVKYQSEKETITIKIDQSEKGLITICILTYIWNHPGQQNWKNNEVYHDKIFKLK